MHRDKFRQEIEIAGRTYQFYDISGLEGQGIPIKRLPFSLRVLMENLLRHLDNKVVNWEDLQSLGNPRKAAERAVEIPFHPARVLMQDFTGVPAVVDLAAMRDAFKALGGETSAINPMIPVELVVDHSIQVDHYGTPGALKQNVVKEFTRNRERYAFLKWAQRSFDNFKVVPPNSGICHQVNLEHLARVAIAEFLDNREILYPDTLVGTDSHTTMINGLGVLGWGVGGIEAEAVMLGQPYFMAIPQVVGVELHGSLAPGVCATDLVLRITELLRAANVVEKFVEFFGEGSRRLSIPDRATIANMSPEYGATMGFFPVDNNTIDYLRVTNRGDQAQIVKAFTKACALFYDQTDQVEYSEVIHCDLSTIEPSLAGPSRPQDRIPISAIQESYRSQLRGAARKEASESAISNFFGESGCLTCRAESCVPCEHKRRAKISLGGRQVELMDGFLAIAAITSCTNTSNPAVLVEAALLARNARRRGLRVPPYVKTSFAPGSRVVVDYLRAAGLLPELESLGFYLAGFGCTTCIGNSGPLAPEISEAIDKYQLSAAAILSGNRNFEARIHQKVKSNFLASPMLVVAFALGGRIDIDLASEPLGRDSNGVDVYLEDIRPDAAEVTATVARHLKTELFAKEYSKIFQGDELWNALESKQESTFSWDAASNYIKNPPYFRGFSAEPSPPQDLKDARVLLVLGDSVTTDHISPAGAIPKEYPAGDYLLRQGVPPERFNSYGSRRGNHEVMMRGTFGNIRLKNLLVAPREGSFTKKFPEGAEMTVFEAATAYQQEAVPLVVLAGKEYGTGSSRDWAAKGVSLLGVKAVIACSFERIHRSNLVGMGVLPLTFLPGENRETLGLDGSETLTIEEIAAITPGQILEVRAKSDKPQEITFRVQVQLHTDIEVKYYRHGGILPFVLRKLHRQK